MASPQMASLLRCVFACVLLLSTWTLSAQGAPNTSADPAPALRDAELPVEPNNQETRQVRRRGYRALMLLSDAAAITAWVGALYSWGDSRTAQGNWLLAAGGAGYFLGPTGLHLAHGQPKRVVRSLGVRGGLLAGGAAFALAGTQDGMEGLALMAFIAGATPLVGAIVDNVLNAGPYYVSAPVPQAKPRRPLSVSHLSVQPTWNLLRREAAITISGCF
jgi:hypothetical protein